MNCLCNPSRPADVRKTAKAGENLGRDFFCCKESKCSFFHWVNAPLPPSYVQRQANAMNSTAKKDGGIPVKIALARFDIGPPHNIWFSVNCPNTPVLTTYYSSIDEKLRSYSSSLKIWLFSFLVYADVVSKLQSNDLGNYDVAELPRFLVTGMKKFISGLPTHSADSALNLESTLMDNLMPFQLDGIQFVVSRGGRALIGDEMGCGKTLQAIGVLQHYHKKWPALVLMPPILLQQWRDELLKFSQELLNDSDIVTVKKTSDRIEGRFKILLVPYSIIDKLVETGKLNPQMFGVVIADESHNLKSIGAQRTTAAIPFLQKASVAVCLSGTPATNRPIELFTQLSGLLPNVFTDYDAFGKRYCDPKPSKFANTTEYKGSSNESELKMLLEGMVMIRRLKEDVVKSLPNKCRELRYVDPDPLNLPQLKAIQKRSAMLESDLRNAASVDRAKIANEQRVLLLEHFKVTGLCKIKAITEELARLVDEARYERAVAESTVSVATVPRNPRNDTSRIDFNEEFEVVQQSIVFESPQECKGLTQSVLDDETVVLDTGRVSRTGSISSEEEEFVVVKPKQPSRDKKKRRLLIHEDEDEEEEEWEGNQAKDRDDGSGSEYEWEEDAPDYEFNGDRWTQANISPVRIKRKKAVAKVLPTATKKSAAAKKPPVRKNVFDEMRSASAAAKNHASPVAATKGTGSSSSSSTPGKGAAVPGLGKKIIVFAHHLDVMNAIEKSLVDLDVAYIRIDGHVTGPQRNLLIKRFQEDDLTDVALLSITACGTGLNLTRANVAVFGELYWSPGVVLQAEDRIHRLGQKSASVRIIYMLGRSTADDIVWDQIQRKHHVLGATVGIGDHKSTNGGGMAIGKGAIVKNNNNKYQNAGNANSSSSSSSAPGAPPVNPYHKDNPYSVPNPYTSNGVSSSSGSTSSSSSSSNGSSYSYTAPAVVAPALPVADFFKPRTVKSSQDNLPPEHDQFQYEEQTQTKSSVPGLPPTYPVPVSLPAPAVTAAAELTAEQRERAERNKRAALERLALKKQNEEQQRLLSAGGPSPQIPVTVVAAAPLPSRLAPASVYGAPVSNGHAAYPPRPGSGGSVSVPYASSIHTATNPYAATGVAANHVDSEYGSTRVVSVPSISVSSNGSGDQYGTPHVFSTGRGSTITTSAQGMQKANQVFGPNGHC